MTSIFRFIFKNDSDFQEFLNTTLSKIITTHDLRFNDKEIDEQLWFFNYDTVLRLIPVPGEMVDDINCRLNSLNISVNQLCNRINANEGILPRITNTDSYPFNEWQFLVEDHQVSFSFIKMNVEPAHITNILNKNVTSSNYINIRAIVYYLFKFEMFNDQVILEEDLDRELHSKVEEYLHSFRFYSLGDKSRLRRQSKTQNEFESLLSSFDKENIAILNDIIVSFKVASEINVSKTNEYLKAFANNLKCDKNFMMYIISMDFSKNNELSYLVKRQMLGEIQGIIDKYNNLPDEQKKLEIYD